MKKIFISMVLMFACLATASTASAQTDNVAYDINEAWFITAGVGGNLTVLGVNGGLTYGGKTWALEVAAGKWFTPSLGLRAGYSGLKYDNNFGNDQTNNIGYFHGDVMVDPIAYFNGYDSERFYSIQPYLSAGFVQCYDNGATDLMVGAGLFNAFRVSEKFDINLDLRAAAYKNNYLQEVGVYTADAIMTATIGATYKFGRASKATVAKEEAVIATNDELVAVKSELANTAENNDKMREQLAKANNDLKDANTAIIAQDKKIAKLEDEAKNANSIPAIVTFDINSSAISNTTKTQLGFWAENIKANPGKEYTLTGYADETTGPASWNDKLSKARAEAVAKILVNTYDVNPSQLNVKSVGGVSPMLEGMNESSRAVILE